jgi:hypothetical protein
MSTFRKILPAALALAATPFSASWAQADQSTGAGTSALGGGNAVTVNPDGSRVPQPAPTPTTDANGRVISTGDSTVVTGFGGNTGTTNGGAVVSGGIDTNANTAGTPAAGATASPTPSPTPSPSASPGTTPSGTPSTLTPNDAGTTTGGRMQDVNTGNGAPAGGSTSTTTGGSGSTNGSATTGADNSSSSGTGATGAGAGSAGSGD